MKSTSIMAQFQSTSPPTKPRQSTIPDRRQSSKRPRPDSGSVSLKAVAFTPEIEQPGSRMRSRERAATYTYDVSEASLSRSTRILKVSPNKPEKTKHTSTGALTANLEMIKQPPTTKAACSSEVTQRASVNPDRRPTSTSSVSSDAALSATLTERPTLKSCAAEQLPPLQRNPANSSPTNAKSLQAAKMKVDGKSVSLNKPRRQIGVPRTELREAIDVQAESENRKRSRRPGGAHWAKRLLGSLLAEEVTVKGEAAAFAVQRLGLSRNHLAKIKLAFDAIDIDGSESIDIHEFFDAFNEKRSPFTDALFAALDVSTDGSLEFEDFLKVTCTYCTYSEEDILRFTFDCFDKDSSGAIDEEEFILLCQIVNNANPLFLGNFAKALQQFDVNEDGLIDFREFVVIYKRHPMILWPAFRLQSAMQRRTLGESGWTRVHERIQRQRHLMEYRQTHEGRDPPKPGCDTPIARACVSLCCCLGPPRVLPSGKHKPA